jgi:tetratricopeptide (TPR) repeat protein
MRQPSSAIPESGRPAAPRALLLTALSVALALSAPPSAAQPSAAMARVDSLLAARQLAPAVSMLDEALRSAPRDYEVLWRLSRVRVLQGDAAPEQSKAQDRLYREALDIAERAIKANPTAPDGYLRRAAAAGKVALFSGVLDAADYVTQAKADAERVIAMRDVPASTLASAHYILGRTHLKLTETPRPLRMPLGLGFGNLPDALTHLKRATELRPGFIMFELEVGRALAQDGRTAEARARLQAVATLAEQELGDEARKREAAELLRTLRP